MSSGGVSYDASDKVKESNSFELLLKMISSVARQQQQHQMENNQEKSSEDVHIKLSTSNSTTNSDEIETTQNDDDEIELNQQSLTDTSTVPRPNSIVRSSSSSCCSRTSSHTGAIDDSLELNMINNLHVCAAQVRR